MPHNLFQGSIYKYILTGIDVAAQYKVLNSQKEKGKQLRKLVLEDIISWGLKDKIRQLQKGHQLAIADRDNQIQAI